MYGVVAIVVWCKGGSNGNSNMVEEGLVRTRLWKIIHNLDNQKAFSPTTFPLINNSKIGYYDSAYKSLFICTYKNPELPKLTQILHHV